jgi:hypothetical protein
MPPPPLLQAFHKSKSVKNKNQVAVCAALIFLACRKQSFPRTFKEICAVLPRDGRHNTVRVWRRGGHACVPLPVCACSCLVFICGGGGRQCRLASNLGRSGYGSNLCLPDCRPEMFEVICTPFLTTPAEMF